MKKKRLENYGIASHIGLGSTCTNTMLDDVRYQFWYKDALGNMTSVIIKVKEKDSELAIATFESLYPNINWRSFKHIS